MNFAAALIAGGRSRRMGRDKAFLDWHGRPLWRVQMEKLTALRPSKLFIAAREDQGFADVLSDLPLEWKIELVNDPTGEDSGPMGAIARCLARAELPLLVLAVDMPAMTTDFLRDQLLARASVNVGVMAREGSVFEPLAAVYPRAALPFFEAAMKAGSFALQTLANQLAAEQLSSVMELSSADEKFFANANSPEEADRLLRFQNESGCA